MADSSGICVAAQPFRFQPACSQAQDKKDPHPLQQPPPLPPPPRWPGRQPPSFPSCGLVFEPSARPHVAFPPWRTRPGGALWRSDAPPALRNAGGAGRPWAAAARRAAAAQVPSPGPAARRRTLEEFSLSAPVSALHSPPPRLPAAACGGGVGLPGSSACLCRCNDFSLCRRGSRPEGLVVHCPIWVTSHRACRCGM